MATMAMADGRQEGDVTTDGGGGEGDAGGNNSRGRRRDLRTFWSGGGTSNLFAGDGGVTNLPDVEEQLIKGVLALLLDFLVLLWFLPNWVSNIVLYENTKRMQ
ncbi:hypothetical protein E2562_026686 [Oryza meyeriana var. granulata]|uniref:Uncharacterized protein n=1 Tax=Oryza meyeriana var. granulata TaxID=110450 RepID=A0A6G1E2E9_9ORYZ|nr:hypothetical protein E2562_026686 [Oryza meyeriana var. granulata]